MSAGLVLDSVRAGYGPVEVLHGVDLQAPKGAVTALIGANGAGKTTLLSVVAGLLPVRSGRVAWPGGDLAGVPAHRRANGGILLVPERGGVFPDLSVRDNLEIFSDGGSTNLPSEFPLLAERLDQPAGSLSGGEQRMLAVCRALLRPPRLLLLDELSMGLAPRVSAQLFEVVQAIAAGATTVLLVEQHLDAALRLAGTAYLLVRGQVAFAGEPAELTGRSMRG